MQRIDRGTDHGRSRTIAILSPFGSRRIVAPRRNVSTLCRVVGDRLIDDGEIPCVPPLARVVTRDDLSWIAYITRPERSIEDEDLTHLMGGGHQEIGLVSVENPSVPVRPEPLPHDLFATALALRGNVLYVSGASTTTDGDPRLIWCTAIEPPFRWQPLPCPLKLERGSRKCVDDLIVDGERLIGVDDVVTPKYFLIYDISTPLRPRFIRCDEIPSHGAYETIHQGVLGSRLIALLSSTGSMAGQAHHIALFDRGSLTEVGTIATWHTSSVYGGEERRELGTWHHVDLLGELLCIAAGPRGIGVLDLTCLPAPGVAQASLRREMDAHDRTTTWRRNLRYHKVAGAEGAEVVKVLGVGPGPRMLVVSRRTRAAGSLVELDTEFVVLPDVTT